MILNLVKTTYAELPNDARVILALQNKPFFAVCYRNNLYVNREMAKISEVTAAIETMWQYDYMATQEIMDTVGAAYNAIVQAEGETAAQQIYQEWSRRADQSRKAKAEKKAAEWIEEVYDKLDDEDWEEICNAGYDSEFVGHGLFRVFSDLQTKHPNSPKYKDYFGNARKAAFVQGFLLGKAAV